MKLLILLLSVASASHIEWAIQHGAYLHENLEYRDNGMYTTSEIKVNELLACIPNELEFKANNGTASEIFNNLTRAPFWKPYVDSLPTTCQNGLCFPINNTLLTVRGKELIEKKRASVNESIVLSRSWTTGMRPVLELFNHHKNANKAVSNGTHHCITSSHYYKPGAQVYDSYSDSGVLQKYLMYGFIEDKELSCEDMQHLRMGTDVQRVACLAYSKSSIDIMIKEIVEAHKQGDMAMIKGASQWLDRNIVFNF